MNVSLFITCLAESYYPRAGIALVKLLEHLGHTVHFPKDQTCCGQALYNNGFHDESADLARKMIRVFEDADYVVTPSGSCAAMVREHYQPLLAGDHAYEHAAKKLAEKTFEYTEFLLNILKLDLRDLNVTWPGKVTYHYSCHLRGLGITDEAVRLLNQIKDLQYIPLEKMEQCCGFGGTFAIKYPQMSGSMVEDKINCIAKTGAQTVVVNDSGCTMNIAGACRRNNIDVKFITLAEIIAEGLGLLDKTDGQPVLAGGAK